MKNYSVFLAPTIKTETGIFANGGKHWERIGTIKSKNKKIALAWLKKNKTIEVGFMFMVMTPQFQI
tara:strand:+ start:5225 stop:5422 length:198 start_codon:yes stop_codon:yes gene_type:complete